MFSDEVEIYVRSGRGGDGVIHFRREKYVPHGGPAGGDGGKGGDVILFVNPKLSTLSRFKKKVHFIAERGKHGGNFNRTGATGEDVIVEIPPGTIVRDAESGELISDMTEPEQRCCVARGGRGGRGYSG